MTQSTSTPQNDSKKTLLWRFILVASAAVLLMIAQTFLRKSGPSTNETTGFVADKGSIAPDFFLQEFKGPKRKLSEIQKKLTLVNFWATWCASCVIEIPSLIQLKNEFESQGLSVLFVSVDEGPEEALPSKLEELKMNFATYIDTEQNLSELFEVSAIPLTVILNNKREILYLEPGERDWHSKEVRAQIKKWLSE